MNQIADAFAKSNIDARFNSVSRATQSLTAQNLDVAGVNDVIRSLAPTAANIDDLQLATYVAQYLIADAVTTGATVLYAEVPNEILAQADLMKANSGASAALYGNENVEIENEDGSITKVTRQRTGRKGGSGPTKLDQAKALFDANPTVPRGVLIDMMVAQIGISKNTGSTYYATFNKDAKRGDGKRAPRNGGGSNRDAQVKAVYESKTEWTDRKELVAAIVEATGCSTASANTFSYKVMPSTGRAKREPKVIKSNEPKTVASVLGNIKNKNAK